MDTYLRCTRDTEPNESRTKLTFLLRCHTIIVGKQPVGAVVSAFNRKEALQMIWAGKCGLFNPRLLDSFYFVEEQINDTYEVLATERQ